MKKNYLITALVIFIISYGLNAQTTLTSWDFNLSTLNPSSGSGALSFVGGTGDPTYINNSGTQALGFAGFPNADTGSGTAGIQLTASTVGYSGISISFDTNGHNQSSKWQQYMFTTDGTNWQILGNNNGGLSSTFATVTLNLPSSCDNNPNFAFRIVSIFNPSGGTQYEQIQGGGYNGSNGKWYFDNIEIKHTTLSNASSQIENLKMYPNPLSGNTLYITSAANTRALVQIFDLMGKEVIKTDVINNAVNTTNLTAGIYMVKITEEEKTATRKLVVK